MFQTVDQSATPKWDNLVFFCITVCTSHHVDLQPQICIQVSRVFWAHTNLGDGYSLREEERPPEFGDNATQEPLHHNSPSYHFDRNTHLILVS